MRLSTRADRDRGVLEAISFLLTNRIPRRLATRFMGWFSRIEHPFIVRPSLAVWRLCAPQLNLREAKKTRFSSVHDCFTRELKEGARPVDQGPDILVSPCDGIVGASGAIRGTEVFQAKGLPYTLEDLLSDRQLADTFRDGRFVTLRLTPSMYHHFHAPGDATISDVIYLPGDTWNVNPATVRRIERLYCRNERAVLHLSLAGSSEQMLLVPVAAILVASIRLTFLDLVLDVAYAGPQRIACAAVVRKGDELGHFSHGSTIVVLATSGLEPCDTVQDGRVLRAGERLFCHAAHATAGLPTRTDCSGAPIDS
jgi:phosphatidylserine decarboxylase